MCTHRIAGTSYRIISSQALKVQRLSREGVHSSEWKRWVSYGIMI
ncbi:hypothetical protein VPHD148_0331 [Vibrio phage D148]